MAIAGLTYGLKCARVFPLSDMRLKFEDVEVRVEFAKLSFVGGTQAIKAKNRFNLDGVVFLEDTNVWVQPAGQDPIPGCPLISNLVIV